MYRAILRLLSVIIPFTFSYSQLNIAVIPLEGKGVSSLEASVLTDRLALELFATGRYTVLERGNMEAILNEQDFQLTGCVSEECVVEVGELLGVESIVAGSISKIGDTFTVGLRLISVETGALDNVASYDHRGSIDQLLSTGMKRVARILSGEEEIVSKGIIERMPLPSATSTTPQIKAQDSGSQLIVLGSYAVSVERGFGVTACLLPYKGVNIDGLYFKPSAVIGYLFREAIYGEELDQANRVYIGLGINMNSDSRPGIGSLQIGIGYGLGNHSVEEITISQPQGTGAILTSTKTSVLFWGNYTLPVRTTGLSPLLGAQFITSTDFMKAFTITVGLGY